jgi:hypothetical protein
MPLLTNLADERLRDHLPPVGELIAIEVTGDSTISADDIATLSDEKTHVHGPEVGGGITRWFIQSDSLQDVRIRLRLMVQRWRDHGLKVRVDADPIDL